VIKGNIKRLASVAVGVSLAVLAMAASAPAAEKEHHPMGEYARFKACPTEQQEAPSLICILAEVHGGDLQIGNLNIPVTESFDLQGGLDPEVEFYPPANGETLTKARSTVPGGILGLVKEGRYPWYLRNFCRHFPNNSECKVLATPEVIGQPSFSVFNLSSEQGVGLELPVRVHLQNPFLGGKCYIGSASAPIVIALTTGSMPPLGVEPEVSGRFGSLLTIGEILAAIGDVVVDNAFAAPGAEGCGGPQSLVVDREIDERQALPAPAGHNRVWLESDLYIAAREEVLNSEA
jgi:hypothetical protein